MSDYQLWILGINPVPWTSPEVGIGRRKGKPFPQVYASAELKAYQAAIREECHDIDGPIFQHLPVAINFYFWRDLPSGIGRERKSRAHYADATNLQKALEDALQGILYANDSQVVKVESWIMEQAAGIRPAILVEIGTISRKPDISPPSPSQSELPLDDREGFNVEEVF